MSKYSTSLIFESLITEKSSLIKNRSGQTFIEFLFIMFAMIMLSFGLLSGLNRSIGVRWEAIVKLIARPSPSNVQLN